MRTLAGVGGVLAGVGDGAAVDQRQPLAAGQGEQAIVDAVPADARLQSGEDVPAGHGSLSGMVSAIPRRRIPAIAAADHLQHRLERLRRQVAVGIGPPHQGIAVPARPRFHRRHRHDLLGQHVETVERHCIASTRPAAISRASTACSSRSPAVLGMSRPLLFWPTRCPARPTRCSAARDVARRFDLADQIDRPHVDAQFQRRRRDDGRQPAFLEGLFGLLPHLQGHAAVMGAGQRAGRSSRALLPRSVAP